MNGIMGVVFGGMCRTSGLIAMHEFYKLLNV